ncbi:MAG TPA: DUF1877 family protein, partial [Polyangia bacterium]|nr:DUF1877 family protein [Polyangia bacterium]
MSVNGAMIRISPEELEWFRTASEEACEEKTESWFWGDDARGLNLAKAYVGVHFLMTGVDHVEPSDGPLSFLGNQDYGENLDYELTYGPARVFPPDAVHEIHRALQALSAEVVKKRAHDPALARVYPFGHSSFDADDR